MSEVLGIGYGVALGKGRLNFVLLDLMKVLLDDGKTERLILAHQSGLEASQPALTQYRVLGPMINGCSWIELQPLTSRNGCSWIELQLLTSQKHQLVTIWLERKDSLAGLQDYELWHT